MVEGVCVLCKEGSFEREFGGFRGGVLSLSDEVFGGDDAVDTFAAFGGFDVGETEGEDFGSCGGDAHSACHEFFLTGIEGVDGIL